MPRFYLFDLDGTLADCNHRLHHIKDRRKNWDAFFAACSKDGPIPHMVELARHLMKVEKLVFVSGRSDQVKAETEQWLKEHGLAGPLYMRKRRDTRPVISSRPNCWTICWRMAGSRSWLSTTVTRW